MSKQATARRKGAQAETAPLRPLGLTRHYELVEVGVQPLAVIRARAQHVHPLRPANTDALTCGKPLL